MSEAVARAAARRLGLEGEVEAVLTANGSGRQYADPTAVAALVVSVADLAWTVYQDLRSRTSGPSRQVIARRIRVEVTSTTVDPSTRDRIIEIVIDETITGNDEQ
ncbi:MAG: hypothetical protein ACJ73S_28130 [Mycobacteriales bacterium]